MNGLESRVNLSPQLPKDTPVPTALAKQIAEWNANLTTVSADSTGGANCATLREAAKSAG
jgi:hypothetical protein